MFASKNSRERRGFQPILENLEDRCVPATISPLAKPVAPTAILVGMLKPANPAALPAVQAPGQLDASGKTAILIGMLRPTGQFTVRGANKIDPQPAPPRAIPVVPNATVFFSQQALVNTPDWSW